MARPVFLRRPVGPRHSPAWSVAVVRAATLRLEVLQIAEIDDDGDSKDHRPPDHDALNYIVYPCHKIGLIRASC